MSKVFDKYVKYTLLLIVSCSWISCSTQKNTAASRSFHQTKVKYNIFFNGNIAFEEGLRATMQANEDDYTNLLPLYPISNHKAAESATAQMDKTIEKCRKCIKLHSIKSKPKIDPKKRNEPTYKLWLQSEEFNNQMGNVWIRLGEAEFSKGDFLGSIGTFNYIIRHYQNDPDILARCHLWVARAYAEMGWQYEAEEALNKAQEESLARKHAAIYASTKADILLKGKQYKDAIPFIKIALPHEKRNVFRPRFYYVLAQLYEREGKHREAIDAYTKCIRMAPTPDMDFNARVHRSMLEGTSSVKSLLKMTKLSKYKDQLDCIYGAIGSIYLADSDTTKALEYYRLAIDKSTSPSMAKAVVLMTAGELYFERRNYTQAQPCYQEVVTIIDSEHEQYNLLQKRSEILDDLIAEYNTVILQDSLQHLAQLSEEEQRKIVDQIIEDLIAAEEKAAEEELLAQREAENGGLQGVDTRNMLGGGFAQDAEWYFYNAQLIKGGKSDFAKKWGNRPLEDNWRRLSKTISMPTSDTGIETEENRLELDSLFSDSTTVASIAFETDTHKPEYYLQQIPKTPEDFALSDSLLASALYNLIFIYEERICDADLARETYERFVTHFPNDGRLLDLYYYYYLRASRSNDVMQQDYFRQLLVSQFPDSKQATIASQSDYFDRIALGLQEQDSLYETAYNAFHRSDFSQVKGLKQRMEQDYPLSLLMPRFLFLNAISVARTEGQDAFIVELRDMITRFPDSELSAMAKDFLAMMGQGMEAQQGDMTNHLGDLRGESTPEKEDNVLTEKALSKNRQIPSAVILYIPIQDEVLLNQLLYEVALFNFSQFMIKDFDLQKMPIMEEGCALRIMQFENMDEAEWYAGLVNNNEQLSSYLSTNAIEIILITEENLELVPSTYNLEYYKAFISHKK